MSMEYRQLGRSGLRVSAITLGTIGFGGTGWASAVGQIDVDDASRQITLARDAGVNLFDTADVYSNGLSEEILGRALGSDRDEVLIATKVRLPMGDGPNDAGLSRHHIIRGLEAICVNSAPTTSTSTRSTNGMDKPRWRRRCRPSTT
jgi:aryl-alcohol dehydrogenase-like predicted oxidoreductase